MRLFLERYADVLKKICGDIDNRYNDDLLSIMNEFAEPILLRPNRYDNWTESSTALDEAINKFNMKMKTQYHLGTKKNVFDDSPDNDSLSIKPISYIFSIIELQAEKLSESELITFSERINSYFKENRIPWRIINGEMIKIDSTQFECDLKEQILLKLQKIESVEPKFQSAYKEYVAAIEAVEKEDYQSAINNASKSYESILKVILEVDRGNASKLIEQYINQLLIVPDTMNKEGFKDKVMMSLPFVRNNSGADHGVGAQEAVISKAMANLAINLAASLNTYLIEEYDESIKIINEKE